MKFRKLSQLVFALALTGYTGYTLLDTFLLSRAQQVQADAVFQETQMQLSPASESVSTLWQQGASIGTWSDEATQIDLREFRTDDTQVYAARVSLSSMADLKTAFAQAAYGKNVTAKTSETAQENNAVLAINGDFYGARETGYVIRNGVLYRSESDGGDVLAIFPDGSFKIVDSSTVSAQELIDEGCWQAFSFGPGLLVDGQIQVDPNTEVGKAMASNPRTAIAQMENGDYLLVTADGRTSESAGLSLYELAVFLQELGAVNAYNLDGGGSSTMVFQGEVINNPTTNGRIQERSVSDIVYIGE